MGGGEQREGREGNRDKDRQRVGVVKSLKKRPHALPSKLHFIKYSSATNVGMDEKCQLDMSFKNGSLHSILIGYL